MVKRGSVPASSLHALGNAADEPHATSISEFAEGAEGGATQTRSLANTGCKHTGRREQEEEEEEEEEEEATDAPHQPRQDIWESKRKGQDVLSLGYDAAAAAVEVAAVGGD
ncbi:hypothetical protein E2C01_027859 [Portunus trituberculatus]|uniref:Uncharacterized protein n=1 Tax=Portunus trituberculatus TaxID=210409 RepID=A0A5B7EMB3_PORTR|nr:hypothetical protein [Portunus trituberculatus]